MTSSQRRQVWVVDDSPTDLQNAERILGAHFALRTFQDGASVLEALSAARKLPDVLVLDWVMEGLSGVDVCRFLNSQPPPLRDVQVLLVTAQSRTEIIVEGLDAGASDFLSKPYAEGELLARVGALLRTRELIDRVASAEADVRRVLINAPDPMITVDSQAVITFANEEMGRAAGRRPKELIGVPLLELIPEFPTQNLVAGPGEALLPLPDVTLGERIFSPSIRILSSDTAASISISLRDVTERRQNEARRLDFYSIIAHDLRTPLAAMLLRTDLILRGKHGVLRPELAQDIQKLGTSMRGLVTMINDFLELARLEGLNYKLERTEVDLRELLGNVTEEFRPLFETRHLEWVDDTPPNPVRVIGDRRRLGQVLTNLIGNAVKFTPAKGRITTRMQRLDDQVELRLSDTGPGIHPDHLSRIFQRYSRVGEQQQVIGSGLGLMIVREIVEAHGGSVGVESELGKGTTFWVRIPAAFDSHQRHGG